MTKSSKKLVGKLRVDIWMELTWDAVELPSEILRTRGRTMAVGE